MKTRDFQLPEGRKINRIGPTTEPWPVRLQLDVVATEALQGTLHRRRAEYRGQRGKLCKDVIAVCSWFVCCWTRFATQRVVVENSRLFCEDSFNLLRHRCVRTRRHVWTAAAVETPSDKCCHLSV